mgnify:CR=1|tara:strand:+ start:270 stop:518 length:249 start_codon:yes stop_codon:yes gene_type:complete
MKTFEFIISSADHRLLDEALRSATRKLAHPETTVRFSVLPTIHGDGTETHARKMVVESSAFHILRDLQRMNLPAGVNTRAVV